MANNTTRKLRATEAYGRDGSIWDRARFQRAIEGADAPALHRLLGVIYARQTEEEKRAGEVSEDNGMGFSGTDGRFLSDLFVKGARWGWTPGQTEAVRRAMRKYATQLVRALQEKGHGPAQQAS